jgi:CheY-like chemotaxis protein
MDSKPLSVLLVGDVTINSPTLLPWLRSRGCHCELAGSCEEACRLVAGRKFDLVLSQYQLRDRTALPLLDCLTGSTTTLFFSTAARNDSRWLAMIERGERRVGAPVMRTPELTAAVEKLLETEPATVKESLFDVRA